MTIGEILKAKQPEIYKALCKIVNQNKDNRINYEQLMRHDSYKRHNGAITQRRWVR